MTARDERKRRMNERKFSTWEKLPDGGRRTFMTLKASMAGQLAMSRK